MRSCVPLLWFVLLLALAASGPGCAYSRFAAPHQAYTPLFDHEGQLDAVASAGGMSEMGSTLSGRIAYSPIRHLTLVGGYDGDFLRDATNLTAHHAGSLGIGTYVRHRVLRLEALAIAGVGYGWGDSYISGFTMPTEVYALEGVYVQAGGQFAIGLEIPYFEFAGGLRVMGQDAEVTSTRLGSPTSAPVSYSRSAFLFDLFVTVRVPVDVVRFEVMLGQTVVADATSSSTDEVPLRLYVTGGLAFQFDTVPVDLDDEVDAELEAAPAAPAAVQSAPPPPGAYGATAAP
jgi:hypothetical protein